jgi:hypothetical protein
VSVITADEIIIRVNLCYSMLAAAIVMTIPFVVSAAVVFVCDRIRSLGVKTEAVLLILLLCERFNTTAFHILCDVSQAWAVADGVIVLRKGSDITAVKARGYRKSVRNTAITVVTVFVRCNQTAL